MENLTPLYDRWLAQLARQERMAALLAGAALLIVVAVATAQARHRRWMLRWAALGFGGLFFAVLVYGLLQPHAHWRLPTFGVLIGQPLWYDETFTWAVARLPLDRLMQAVAGDVHPPLWYLVEWVTIRLLGSSEVALRLPALFFGLAGLGLTYRLALDLGYRRPVALGAACLLAALPAWRYYSQEARMYTLLACGVLLATLGLVTCRRWLMALGMIVTLYTHNLGALYMSTIAGAEIASGGIMLLWQGIDGDTKYPGRGQIVKHGVTTLAWLVLVGLVWLPWLAWLLSQANRVATGFWVPDYGLGGYLLGLFEVTLGAGCPDLLHVHAMLAAVGLLALALWYAWRDPGRGLVPLVLVLVPTGSLVIVSEIWRPVYVARALLPSLPFLSILAAAALARLRSEYRRVILAALVPVLVLAGVWQAKSGMGGARLAGDVAAHYHDGDVIYHANLASYILLSYYLPAQEYRQAVWPDAGNLSQALTVETQQAMGIPRQAAGQIDARRLLVLWIENPMTTAAEVAELEAALALGEATRLTRWEADTAGLATVALWEVSLSPVREGESPGAQ